jgi:hypothetical protein
MTRAELERLLEQADRVVELRAKLDRARRLEQEMETDADIDRSVPEVVSAVQERRDEITSIARELEREWVVQGPMMSAWQRAAELTQMAEASGADASDVREEAAQARDRLESARLSTRDQRQRLVEQRDRLVDCVLELPLEVELPPPVRDDGRPEAVRRDALAYAELAEQVAGAAERVRLEAKERLQEARGELAELGSVADLERELRTQEQGLPGDMALPDDAPPSAGPRLRRAGVSVSGGAGV